MIKVDNKLEKLLNKYFKWVVIVIPLIMYYISVTKYLGVNESLMAFTSFSEYFDHCPDLFKFDFYNDISKTLFNILYWSLIFLYIVRIYHKLDFVKFLIIIVLITFFNPFSYGIVFKLLTNEVFFRISDILFNPLIFIILVHEFEELKSCKILVVIYIVLATTSIINSRIPNYISFEEDLNRIYHSSDVEYNTVKILTKDYLLNTDDSEINVVSHISGAPLFSEVPINSLVDYRFMYMDTEENELFVKKYNDQGHNGIQYNKACSVALKYNVDLFIIDAQHNWQLEEGLWPCIEKMFEYENFRVFKMRADLYKINLEKGWAIE